MGDQLKLTDNQLIIERVSFPQHWMLKLLNKINIFKCRRKMIYDWFDKAIEGEYFIDSSTGDVFDIIQVQRVNDKSGSYDRERKYVVTKRMSDNTYWVYYQTLYSKQYTEKLLYEEVTNYKRLYYVSGYQWLRRDIVLQQAVEKQSDDQLPTKQ